jgi:hypothetical protein
MSLSMVVMPYPFPKTLILLKPMSAHDKFEIYTYKPAHPQQ